MMRGTNSVKIPVPMPILILHVDEYEYDHLRVFCNKNVVYRVSQ